jgi:hypothetical protein
MEFIVSAMNKGGAFMYLIALLSVVGFFLPVLLGVFSVQAKRVPALLWVLMPGLVLMAGIVGTAQGLQQASDAVVHASPDIRPMLSAAGMSVGLMTQFFGAALAAGLLGLTAWIVGLGGLRRGEGAVVSVIGAGAVAGVVGLGGLGCIGFSLSGPWSGPELFIGVALLFSGLPLAIGSVFTGGSDSNQARQAENRLAAAVCLLGCVGACVIAVLTEAQIKMYEAFAYASPEIRARMASGERMLDEASGQVGLVAMTVATLAALLALAPVARSLGNVRTAVSAGGVLLGLLCWAGLSGLVDALVADLPLHIL